MMDIKERTIEDITNFSFKTIQKFWWECFKDEGNSECMKHIKDMPCNSIKCIPICILQWTKMWLLNYCRFVSIIAKISWTDM